MSGALALEECRGPPRKLALQHAALLRKTMGTSRPPVGPGRYPQRQQDGWLAAMPMIWLRWGPENKTKHANCTSWTTQPSDVESRGQRSTARKHHASDNAEHS